MFKESVAQNPIIAVSEGMNTPQNSPTVLNFDGLSSIGPNPPACPTAQTSSTTAMTSTIGAAQFSNTRTAFMPRKMIQMLSDQKIRKVIADERLKPASVKPPPSVANDGQIATRNVFTASPPMKVWIPNHPQATIARKI